VLSSATSFNWFRQQRDRKAARLGIDTHLRNLRH
jgi:hypothetical protein